MRIWSLHPQYLDAKGLVALWRESLLAKHVLEGNTKGYKNHPQLHRFKESTDPLDAINHYLSEIYLEASQRGYAFDKEKISWSFKKCELTVTQGQLSYEVAHLLNKLQIRDRKRFEEIRATLRFEVHPLFIVVAGDIEKWEVITD